MMQIDLLGNVDFYLLYHANTEYLFVSPEQESCYKDYSLGIFISTAPTFSHDIHEVGIIISF